MTSARCAGAVGMLLAAAVVALTAEPASSGPRVRLAAIFGDGMILQRERAVPIWGWGPPGAVVTVSVPDQRQSTRVSGDGRWRLDLPPMPAGGPIELVVTAADTLVVRDVLIGDVWIAAGQSNMEMPVDGWGKVQNYEAEVESAEFPQIRLLQVSHGTASAPQPDFQTNGWRRCSPESVRDFSATAYFFGQGLHRALGIPIGLVQSTWGGTVIEAWMGAAALERLPEFRDALDDLRLRTRAGPPQEVRDEYEKTLARWRATIPSSDPGMEAQPPWASRDFDRRGWKVMQLPGAWEDAGYPDLDGVVWFCKEVDVPGAWAGHDVGLHLGRIDDSDITYFDGVPVGHDSVYNRPRDYVVPAALVHAGPHVIVVRVLDWIGAGGMWGDAAMMNLVGVDSDSVPLAGPWQYAIGMDLRKVHPRPANPDDPNRPTVLSNAMVDPLVPFGIRGVAWYQGESNAPRAEQYRTLFPMLIADWRDRWGQGDFPFVFVQLANWQERETDPEESEWAELREAQAMALSLPNTGMAVAIDIGDERDIHPKNKQEVGRRMTLAALRVAYGLPGPATGPVWRSMKTNGGRVRLAFAETDGGLVARDGGAPTGFAIAGADRRFLRATARIDGDEVEVWNDLVEDPVAVRYAWANNPGCDLVSRTGLPAAPFRTDAWPGLTAGRR